VAGLLTLSHGDTVVYKYGGSDAALHPLGGIPFLFWKVIEEAKGGGAHELDLGRSDHDGIGLIRFKEHLAATPSTLTYWRSPAGSRAVTDQGWPTRVGGRLLARLPGTLRRAAGAFLYPHSG